MMRLKLVVGMLLIVSLLAGGVQAVKAETGDEGDWQVVRIAHDSEFEGISILPNQFAPTNPGDDSGDPVKNEWRAERGIPPEEYWP